MHVTVIKVTLFSFFSFSSFSHVALWLFLTIVIYSWQLIFNGYKITQKMFSVYVILKLKLFNCYFKFDARVMKPLSVISQLFFLSKLKLLHPQVKCSLRWRKFKLFFFWYSVWLLSSFLSVSHISLTHFGSSFLEWANHLYQRAGKSEKLFEAPAHVWKMLLTDLNNIATTVWTAKEREMYP